MLYLVNSLQSACKSWYVQSKRHLDALMDLICGFINCFQKSQIFSEHLWTAGTRSKPAFLRAHGKDCHARAPMSSQAPFILPHELIKSQHGRQRTSLPPVHIYNCWPHPIKQIFCNLFPPTQRIDKLTTVSRFETQNRVHFFSISVNNLMHSNVCLEHHSMREIVALQAEQRTQVTVYKLSLWMFTDYFEQLLVNLDLVRLALITYGVDLHKKLNKTPH